jgi:hypothetical protein
MYSKRVGEPQTQVTLGEAIRYEPVSFKLAIQMDILKNCCANCYGRPRKSSKGLLPRIYFRRDYVASHRFLDASEVGSRDYDVSRSFSSSGEVATLY